MKQNTRNNQTGYALMLMVLALMGIGGVVLTGFTQGAKQVAEHERYLHNQRVLKEAKQALLQYAYNYPQLGPDQDDGPGRLPCPDIDNDGLENFSVDLDLIENCDVEALIVGRFPWEDPRLNFYEAKDASGEHLWFAVSNEFTRGAGSVVNSGTNGTIAIHDRSGALLYPPTFAANVFGAGVAAVIIAPGPAMERNDGTMQVRGTDAEKSDVTNYLDNIINRDNASFVNDTVNGFVTGPVFNPVDGSLVINDQLIVITAAEVIEMAEKATLQAYRDAINDYLDKAVGCIGEVPEGSGTTETICLAKGGSWDSVYPWLYNYRGVSIADQLDSYYPAFANFDDERDPDPDPDPDTGYLDNYGRIPSIFSEYFTDSDSQPFETALGGSIVITIPQPVSCFGCDIKFTFNDDQFQFNGLATEVTGSFSGNQILTDLQFVDIAGTDTGRLRGTAASAALSTLKLYFYDNDVSPAEIYTPCGDADGNGITELRDCHRKSDGSLYSGIEVVDPLLGINPNEQESIILLIEVPLGFSYDIATNIFNIDMNYSNPIITVSPATGDAHATIAAEFDDTRIINSTFPTISGVISWQIDEHYHVHEKSLNRDSLDNVHLPHGSGTLDSSGFAIEGPLTLGIRYYPELPAWALANGWHNSIRMAYADISLPGLAGNCVPLTDCLFLPDERGGPRNIASLLVIAGEHDWVDDNAVAPVIVGLEDELPDIFDDGNQNNDRSFSSVGGNDRILLIEEQP